MTRPSRGAGVLLDWSGAMGSTVPSCPVALETVSLETIDGVRLEADVIWAAAGAPRAFVVVGHPHPLHGGDRHSHVVRAIQYAAHRAGCHSIAPDFRGAGGSFGDHDNGDSERLDLAAACEFIDLVENAVPVIMAGYSFGSVVGLNVSNPAISGWLAVAPPTAMMTPRPLAASHHAPKRILLPRHDQFSSVDAMEATVAGWANTTVTVLESVDHFIAAGAEDACCAALDLLLDEVL